MPLWKINTARSTITLLMLHVSMVLVLIWSANLWRNILWKSSEWMRPLYLSNIIHWQDRMMGREHCVCAREKNWNHFSATKKWNSCSRIILNELKKITRMKDKSYDLEKIRQMWWLQRNIVWPNQAQFGNSLQRTHGQHWMNMRATTYKRTNTPRVPIMAILCRICFLSYIGMHWRMKGKEWEKSDDTCCSVHHRSDHNLIN